MSEIDCDKKTFIRDYYPLDKAVKEIKKYIVDFDTDDLLHLAATATVPISIHIPEFEPLDSFIARENFQQLKEFSAVLDEGDMVEELRIDKFTTLLNIVNDSIDDGAELGPYKVSLRSSEHIGMIRADICGIWDIPAWAAELLEIYKETNISKISWLYPSLLDESESFIALVAHGNQKINLSNVVVTAEVVNNIIGNKHVEATSSGLIKSRGSHIAEYHSANRESILKAAINLISINPSLCKNNTKLAQEIHDHAYKFWGSGEPPLSIKSISELIGRAKSGSARIK